ncbi:MAG: anti-sigma factor antagonist [Clostridia bacterium]|nr:anti-sigma factor antagonist [Clostridia bacterium]
MDIKFSTGRHTLTIYLCGELDEYVADNARQKIDDAICQPGITTVVFDLSNLSFMDSTGIGVLIGRYKKLKARGVPVCVKNVSEPADKIFKMAGLYTIMPKVK